MSDMSTLKFTRNILIDTSVYAASHMNLRSQAFEQLHAQVRELGLKVFYDDTIHFECCRRIADIGKQLARAHDGLSRATKGWNMSFKGFSGRDPVSLPADLNTDKHIADAQKAFFARLEFGFNGQRYEHQVSLDTLWARYRAMEPPFHEAGSKEFPDAIIVEGAAALAKRMGEEIFIVSGDKKMLAAAEFHDGLIAAGSLDDLLQILTHERDPNIIQEANDYVDAPEFIDCLGEVLEPYLEEQLAAGNVVYTGNYDHGGPTEIYLNGVEDIGPFKVVAFDDETITCVSPIGVSFHVDAEFEWVSDPDKDSWNSTQKSYDWRDRNRAYIVFERPSGEIKSVSFINRIEFGDPYD